MDEKREPTANVLNRYKSIKYWNSSIDCAFVNVN